MSTSPVGPFVAASFALLAGGLGWSLARVAPPPASNEIRPADVRPAPPPPPEPERTLASWPLVAPDPSTIPEGPLGDAIRRGQRIATRTREELPAYVGNDLHCASCHLGAGTVADAGPWVGLVGAFPDYRARSGKVDTVEVRINDCFERSMNGKPLPADGEEMTALVAYMTWLSQGVPVGARVEGRGFRRIADPPAPNPDHGAAVYAENCVQCHGQDGQGRVGLEAAYVYPPLWGDRSFNVGAGMARLDTAAAFVHSNMPVGQHGTISEQDAYDVAAWVIAKPRPDFARKFEDWPRGEKPRDARY